MSVSTLYRTDASNIPATSMTNKCIFLDLDATLISTQDTIESLKDIENIF